MTDEKVTQEASEENFKARVRYYVEIVEDYAGVYSDEDWIACINEKFTAISEREQGSIKFASIAIEDLAHLAAILQVWGTHRGIKNSPIMIG